MPAIATSAPDNPDFARVVAVRALPSHGGFPFDVAPDEREAAALARLLDARSVRKLRFRGVLRPEGAGWVLEAELGATVVQTCVVTLDPVTTRIDQPVRRLFLPGEPNAAEVEVLPDGEEDEVEPLGERIDLGLVAIEALALALPPYPRKDGATLPEGADMPDDAETARRPFAGLAAMRDRMGQERKS
jgi:uncharacterized metal-binding protein YceD (DUF177 family)